MISVSITPNQIETNYQEKINPKYVEMVMLFCDQLLLLSYGQRHLTSTVHHEHLAAFQVSCRTKRLRYGTITMYVLPLYQGIIVQKRLLWFEIRFVVIPCATRRCAFLGNEDACSRSAVDL